MAQAASAQEALMVLESYQRQLEAVGRQIDFLQGVLDDVVRAKKALEGLGEEKSPEILLPIGASTFIRGEVKQKDTVLTGIGAGYATERPRTDAIERLTARADQVQKELDRLMQGAIELQQEAARIQDALDEAAAAAE
jgi:prefoldin alpha subunit